MRMSSAKPLRGGRPGMGGGLLANGPTRARQEPHWEACSCSRGPKRSTSPLTRQTSKQRVGGLSTVLQRPNNKSTGQANHTSRPPGIPGLNSNSTLQRPNKSPAALAKQKPTGRPALASREQLYGPTSTLLYYFSLLSGL